MADGRNMTVIATKAEAPVSAGFASFRRPDACFLAQLIAARHGLMQTRARKRTTPEQGVAVYGQSDRRIGRRGRLDLAL